MNRVVSTLVSVLLSGLLAGCLVTPVPTTKRVEGPGVSKRSADIGFLKAGTTTREEVTEKLAWADTGVKDDHLFVGRWLSSSSAWIWFFAGNNSSTGGGKRNWTSHNLLIEFDQTGKVTQFRDVPDKRLYRELSACLLRVSEPPLDLSHPVEIVIDHRHASGHGQLFHSAKLILNADALQFQETGNSKHDFTIARDKLGSLRTPLWDASEAGPSVIEQTLEFDEKIAVGRKLTFRLDPQKLVVLTKYLNPSQR